MPQCQFLFSAVFYFRKVVQEIFSELNGTNCQHLIITKGRHCQKMTGGGSARWPDPTPARPSLGPRRGGVWAHPGSPDSALCLFILLFGKTLGDEKYSTKSSIAAVIYEPVSGGFWSSSRHPTGGRNHRRRPSLSLCLPLR